MKKFVTAVMAAVIIGSALSVSMPQTPQTPTKPVTTHSSEERVEMRKVISDHRHRMPSAETTTVDCWYDGQYIYVDIAGRDGDTPCELSLTAGGNTLKYTTTASELWLGLYVGEHQEFHLELQVYGLGLYTGDYNK